VKPFGQVDWNTFSMPAFTSERKRRFPICRKPRFFHLRNSDRFCNPTKPQHQSPVFSFEKTANRSPRNNNADAWFANNSRPRRIGISTNHDRGDDQQVVHELTAAAKAASTNIHNITGQSTSGREQGRFATIRKPRRFGISTKPRCLASVSNFSETVFAKRKNEVPVF
jgi:hypothetical protein